MKSEEAFEFVNKLFLENQKTSLSQCEKDIIIGIWEGKTYEVTSQESKWAYQTVKEDVSRLNGRVGLCQGSIS
ncbi:hypothetical protein BZZ01_09870 [Nostocales cyanobacterium HT-58-2]|nr:hypothetical protein BZZ01_09870 [Nostocales cyanobacterium HT-58-2]